jgi:hypothetical protein
MQPNYEPGDWYWETRFSPPTLLPRSRLIRAHCLWAPRFATIRLTGRIESVRKLGVYESGRPQWSSRWTNARRPNPTTLSRGSPEAPVATFVQLDSKTRVPSQFRTPAAFTITRLQSPDGLLTSFSVRNQCALRHSSRSLPWKLPTCPMHWSSGLDVHQPNLQSSAQPSMRREVNSGP